MQLGSFGELQSVGYCWSGGSKWIGSERQRPAPGEPVWCAKHIRHFIQAMKRVLSIGSTAFNWIKKYWSGIVSEWRGRAIPEQGDQLGGHSAVKVKGDDSLTKVVQWGWGRSVRQERDYEVRREDISGQRAISEYPIGAVPASPTWKISSPLSPQSHLFSLTHSPSHGL